MPYQLCRVSGRKRGEFTRYLHPLGFNCLAGTFFYQRPGRGTAEGTLRACLVSATLVNNG